MKTVFSFILSFFISSIYSQSNPFKYLDSIKYDKNKVESILKIPFDQATKNINSYDSLINKAILLSKKINDSILLAESYDKKALTLHFTSKDEKGLEYTLKAISIYELYNLKHKVGNSYLNLGWKIKYRDLESAINYMRKGIKILDTDKGKNNKSLVSGFNNYGVLLNYKNKLDSAILYHKKSLLLAKELNDSIGIPFAYTHIGSVLLKQKKYNLAKTYIDSSLQIRIGRNDVYGITDSQLYLGDLYYEMRNYNSAVTHFKKAYDLATSQKFYPLKKYASEFLFKSYENNNQFKEALYYQKIFTKMKDSILNKDTNSKISELSIKYKTSEKEKEIAIQKEKLLENELAIQNRNLYTAILSSILIIVLIVWYGLFRKNQFKRKQLQKEIDLKDALSKIKTQNRLQEQRLSISRDLHDNIGSQLTFIISSIDNLKFITKKLDKPLQEKLSQISTFTSDTIFQLRDTIWAMNKSEISIQDFYSRLLSYIEKAKLATPNTKFKLENKSESNHILSSLEGMHLFRVLQEAVNNAIKYSEANEIKIFINEDDFHLFFEVIDNGKGFDILNTTLGSGLSNMEKRTSKVNAKLYIKSEETKGTEIKVKLPKNTTNAL